MVSAFSRNEFAASFGESFRLSVFPRIGRHREPDLVERNGLEARDLFEDFGIGFQVPVFVRLIYESGSRVTVSAPGNPAVGHVVIGAFVGTFPCTDQRGDVVEEVAREIVPNGVVVVVVDVIEDERIFRGVGRLRGIDLCEAALERVVRIVVVAPVRHPVVDIESVRTVDEDIVFIVVVRTASHQHGMQSRLVEDVADYGHVAGAVVVVEPGYTVFGAQVVYIIVHEFVAQFCFVPSVVDCAEVVDFAADVVYVAVFDQVVVAVKLDGRRRCIENLAVADTVAYAADR